jgi:predicted phage-related endonuclease
MLRARVDAFWHGNVLAGVEPVADGLADTSGLLADRAVKDEVRIDLPAEARNWLTGYRVNHEAIAAQEEAKREWGNALRQYLVQHEASAGYLGDEKVVTFKRGAKGAQLRVKGVSW